MSQNYNQQAVRAGLAYTIASFFVAGSTFITTPIFTRLLDKEVYGAFNNYTSWLAILTILVTIKASASFVSARFDYKETFDQYIFSIMVLSSITVGICLIVVNLIPDRMSHWLNLDIIYINMMLIYILFNEMVYIYQVREQYVYRYKNSVIISIAVCLSTALLSVIFVYFGENKLLGRILGYSIPSILLGGVIFLCFWKKNRLIKIEHWIYAIPLVIPYIPHLLSLTVLQSVDRIMITKICGLNETALYSLAYMCSSIVTIVMSSMNIAYSPWLADNLSKGQLAEIKKFSYSYIFIFLFLVVGIMLIAPEVLLVLGGRNYIEAIDVMPPVMIGCAFQLLYTMHVNIEQFKKKTVGMAVASVLAAVFNYGLNAVFIPYFGYIAAAYTTLVSYLLLLLLHMYLVYRLRLGVIYDNQYIAFVVIAALLMSAGMNLIYKFVLIRWLLILLYAIVFIVVIYKNRGQILKWVSSKEI